MKETGKRILALVMALCLTLALGTTALAAEGTEVTASASGTLQAGVSGGEIKVNASGNFISDNDSLKNKFQFEGADLTVASVTGGGSTDVTLTMNAPTKAAKNVTVKIDADAFEPQATSQVDAGNEVTINAAADPTVTASGSLVAGQQGTITLTSNDNHFVASPQGTWFTLEGCATSNPSVVNGGNGASVNFSVTPTSTSGVTVSIDPQAFTYQPGESVSCDSVSVSAPSVTAEIINSPELTVGVQGTFQITATGSDFKDSNPSAELFTLSGGGVEHPTSVTADGTTATLTVTPEAKSDITVTSIGNDAFKYTPATEVKPTGSVTVNNPTGTVTEALKGDQLYVGTNVSGQTIELKASGLSFNEANSVNKDTYFKLTGDAAGGLSIADATGSGDTVTLTLGGNPTQNGTFQVQVRTAAFVYAPDGPVNATEAITVNPAPEVKLAQADTVIAGDSKEIKLQINTPDYVKFAAGPTTSNFIVNGQQVSGVSITDSGTDKNVTLTLSAAPADTSRLTVNVKKEAFTPVAKDDVTVEIEVQAPSGPVTAALSGSPNTLTAGKDAGGTEITLNAGGSLNFKSSPVQGNFTLEKGTGELGTLTVSSAAGGGKTVTLQLTGIPQKQGTFKVKVAQDAFVASPEQDETTGDIDIGFATVTVTPSPDHIVEDMAVDPITLNAEGSTFNAVDQTKGSIENFSISGADGITLESVTSTGDNKAVLTFSGLQEEPGTMKITIQPAAFKYQPENNIELDIGIDKPSGKLNATLNNGPLSAGTPVTTQTITLDITGSKGLHFAESGLQAGSFTLVETKPDGLEISGVTYVSPTQVTLTLTGTPAAAGSFKVQAAPGAFKAAPEAVQTTENQLEVQAAPTGSVTAALSGELHAGTPADGTTVTLTATGLTFAAADKSNFTLTGTFADMTIADAKLSGGKIVLTLSGTPAAAGTFQVKVAQKAFTVYPAADVNSDNITVGAANIKLALSDNGLQAGKENMTFKVTPSGGKLIDLANRAAAIDTGADLDGLTLGDMTQNADGSVTVAIMGMPPSRAASPSRSRRPCSPPRPRGPSP